MCRVDFHQDQIEKLFRNILPIAFHNQYIVDYYYKNLKINKKKVLIDIWGLVEKK